VLRRIRVASKNELKARIIAYLDDLNREPVIHTWTYKIDTVAWYASFHGNAVLARNGLAFPSWASVRLMVGRICKANK
jgi:hypothetical protein